LDTHVFLWAILDDPKLASTHRALLTDPDCDLFLSAASLWESLIKSGLGKLPLPKPAATFLLTQMAANRVNLLPISGEHLVELEILPPIHRDPFDRMLIAQARAEQMPILTADAEIKKYEVTVL
jgi:PIN domain nuclease of toxin-antitoxin system